MMQCNSIAYFAAVAALTAATASAQTPLTTELVASGFSRPVWAGSPPGDTERIFVIEQNTARVRIIKDGSILPLAFLDIAGKVQSSGNEQGLLGLAFHPDYSTNGFFYVNYTKSGSNSGDTIVERYQVSANPDVANAGSGTVMIGPIDQPFSNHNGGGIAFGPDGFLYIGMGDGGSAGDPGCRAQDGLELLGKMLRIDVDNGGVAPPSNPYVGDPAFDNRIWAYGLRNPWRFSFDRANGDLYIGDVGQNNIEEIDWVPGISAGKENYGWKVMEGNNCFSASACAVGTPLCNSPLFTDPVVTYNHSQGCSVTGGYAYRGCAIPDLSGTYFYGDYCSARIWSFRMVGGMVTAFQERTAELNPAGGTINNILSFGEDAAGEILICDQGGGEIWKIVPQSGGNPSTYGTGELGSKGTVAQIGWGGVPVASGLGFDVTLAGGNWNSFTVMFSGKGNTPNPQGWGTILVSGPQFLRTITMTDGGGNASLAIAMTPATVGMTFYFQYAVRDPGFGGNVQASDGLEVLFCP